MIEVEKRSNGKICINQHLNENVRGNQKYCRVCRAPLIDPSEDREEEETEEVNNDDDLVN